MSEPVDMSATITHKELFEAISASEHRIIEALWRVFREQEQTVADRFRVAAVENARMFRALEESIMARVSALLEPHDGVPERVRALETELPPRLVAVERAVFPPPAPRRKKKSS